MDYSIFHHKTLAAMYVDLHELVEELTESQSLELAKTHRVEMFKVTDELRRRNFYMKHIPARHQLTRWSFVEE